MVDNRIILGPIFMALSFIKVAAHGYPLDQNNQYLETNNDTERKREKTASRK